MWGPELMSPILAYFDPGAGSLLLQALLGGAGGLLVAVRYAWSRVMMQRARRQMISSGR
jgi:hypothetical protein